MGAKENKKAELLLLWLSHEYLYNTEMHDTMTVIPHNYTPYDATHDDMTLDITLLETGSCLQSRLTLDISLFWNNSTYTVCS